MNIKSNYFTNNSYNIYDLDHLIKKKIDGSLVFIEKEVLLIPYIDS